VKLAAVADWYVSRLWIPGFRVGNQLQLRALKRNFPIICVPIFVHCGAP
jgi:hypothetical protein